MIHILKLCYLETSWAGTFKTSSIGQLQSVVKGHILFETFYHGNKEIHLLSCNLKIFGAFVTLMNQVIESCYHGNRDTFVTLLFEGQWTS